MLADIEQELAAMGPDRAGSSGAETAEERAERQQIAASRTTIARQSEQQT